MAQGFVLLLQNYLYGFTFFCSCNKPRCMSFGEFGTGTIFKLLCFLETKDFFPSKDLLPPSWSSMTHFLISHLVGLYLPCFLREENVGVTTKVYQSWFLYKRAYTTNNLIIPWWVKMALVFFLSELSYTLNPMGEEESMVQ